MYDEMVKRLRYCADSDKCSECKYRFGSPDGSKLCMDLLMVDAADAIEELNKPRWVSVVERKTGKWIKHEDGTCSCSVCHLGLETWVAGIFYNFCPNCGADMQRKGKNNE